MRSISVTMSTTLDGVVQGLGRDDEDTRGGFRHGGWGPLLIHPLVLGGGARLFDETSALTEFTLAHSVTTSKGVIIATYDRA